jgi:hypothetical protein
MTPKITIDRFKWFETFNNKELENFIPLYDDDEHFSPKLKIHNPKQMVVKVNKLYGNGGRMHSTDCRA